MQRKIKRIVSMMLIAVMVVSTIAVAAVPTSAAETKVKYTIETSTPSHLARSADIIKFRVNGKNKSTGFNSLGSIGYYGNGTASFNDVDVDVQSITLFNVGCNGWFPDYITVKKEVNGKTETTKFWVGRWIDNGKETTVSKSDKVFKVTLETADELYAGTDSNIGLTLFDKNGKSSDKFDLTEIHSAANAFERGDVETFYLYVRDDFGELNKCYFCDLYKGHVVSIWDEWKLHKVSVEQITGNGAGKKYSQIVDKTIEGSSKKRSDFTVYF